MYRVPDLSRWRGRVDDHEVGDTRRVYNVIRSIEQSSRAGIVLVGFQCDEGVRRNSGRVGAALAPDAIRSSLASMAWHAGESFLYDGGDVICVDGALEDAQEELAKEVSAHIHAGHLPIVMGGGHEVAYGTGSGVFLARPKKRVGIINIDTHLDLRLAKNHTSGTPFLDLEHRCKRDEREFGYLCVGAARASNTSALFDRCESLGGAWISDEAARSDPDATLHATRQFVDDHDDLYLSIDLDVFPSCEAPGVSAPSSLGLPAEFVIALVREVVASEKLQALDLAEMNPTYDIDNRTARLAARLIHTAIHARTV